MDKEKEQNEEANLRSQRHNGAGSHGPNREAAGRLPQYVVCPSFRAWIPQRKSRSSGIMAEVLDTQHGVFMPNF